jgi:hypothetical protein
MRLSSLLAIILVMLASILTNAAPVSETKQPLQKRGFFKTIFKGMVFGFGAGAGASIAHRVFGGSSKEKQDEPTPPDRKELPCGLTSDEVVSSPWMPIRLSVVFCRQRYASRVRLFPLILHKNVFTFTLTSVRMDQTAYGLSVLCAL